MRWRLKAENVVSGMSRMASYAQQLGVLATCLGEGAEGTNPGRKMEKREHHDNERPLGFPFSAGKEK